MVIPSCDHNGLNGLMGPDNGISTFIILSIIYPSRAHAWIMVLMVLIMMSWDLKSYQIFIWFIYEIIIIIR